VDWLYRRLASPGWPDASGCGSFVHAAVEAVLRAAAGGWRASRYLLDLERRGRADDRPGVCSPIRIVVQNGVDGHVYLFAYRE
jgi:hypothetical protein